MDHLGHRQAFRRGGAERLTPRFACIQLQPKNVARGVFARPLGKPVCTPDPTICDGHDIRAASAKLADP